MKLFTVDTIRAFVPDERRPYECALVYPAVFSERQCGRILQHAAGEASKYAGRVGRSEQHRN